MISKNSTTLTLDITARPMGIIPVEQAVSRVAQSYIDKKEFCQVIESDANKIFHSAGFEGENIIEIEAPLIIMTRHVPREGIDFQTVSKRERQNVARRVVFLRDKMACQYCGFEVPSLRKAFSQLTIDHVKPRHMFKDKSAANTYDNVTTACVSCNQRKADKLPYEVGMHPKTTPKTPHYVQMKFAGRLNEVQRKYVADYFRLNPDEIMF